MRPIALEIEGYTAFREPTRVVFDDLDLFALTGPTGAGKSSLIDAMVFALYGSVPRLDEKAVSPVISQGMQRARVRLDFSLGGVQHTAVRVVHAGPKPTEVSLERDGVVLAAKVGDFNAQIKELIGLSFKQFTTCVVLPQGDFARFLKATPGDRQALLKQLLGLRLYEQVRERANMRKVTSEAAVQASEVTLASLGSVTKKDEKGLARRVSDLEELEQRTKDELVKLSDLQNRLDGLEAARQALAERRKQLGGLAIPDGVRLLPKAKQLLHEAQGEADKANSDLKAALEARSSLGDVATYVSYRRHHSNYERRVQELDGATRTEQKSRGQLNLLTDALKEAGSAVHNAVQAVLDARFKHAAHGLRANLAEGEPCPVCEQTVIDLPSYQPSPDLAELEKLQGEAETHHEGLRVRHASADRKHASDKALRDKALDDSEDAKQDIHGLPSLADVETVLSDIGNADARVSETKARTDAASAAVESATASLTELERHPEASWGHFHSKRDGLAEMDPPKPSDDLSAAWDELMAWATKEAPSLDKKVAIASDQVAGLKDELARRNGSLAIDFEKHDVPFDENPLANLARSIASVEEQIQSVKKSLARKKKIKSAIRRGKRDVAVASSLWAHLNARHFERWLLSEFFRRLATGASEILRHHLSNGRYSFRHAGDEFEVIDHANAGEARSSRTLSGGETFLASLSLALALADQVADLATEGTAQLESIFLDEGFGTLDPDTLDVVATAIEELAARGRLVGVVTHVPDLAQRMPVQFKVAKASGSASVQRIDT